MKNKILLIDDDAVTRDSLRNALQGEHYNVFFAESKQQAMERHGGERINLLLISPGASESCFAATMKWLAAIDRRVPVILLAKNSTADFHLEATAADAVMKQPVSVPMLLQKIAGLINESVAARDKRVAARQGQREPFVASDNAQACGLLRARSDVPYVCDRSNLFYPPFAAADGNRGTLEPGRNQI